MEAVKLKQVDKDYRNHLQAFLNLAVKAEQKTGKNKSKLVYSKFKRFYDYENAIEEAQGKKNKPKFPGIGELLKKRE